MLSTLCLCIGLFLLTVYAASNISFNVTSSLNFNMASYFTFEGSSITGFSDEYLNLEIKPETLIIPNTDGKGNSVTSIANGSSSAPTLQGLESSNVIVDEGITSIGNSVFKNCSSLISVSLPSTLKSIGTFAFDGCSSLTSVEIPSSVTSIGWYAFHDCSSLATVTFETGSQLTSIGNSAFDGCTGLTGGLVIPASVTEIGSYVFHGCSLLESVTFEANSQLTIINRFTFDGCSSLASIEIPSSVTSIGDSAFSNCTNLISLTINTQTGYVWQKASDSAFTSNVSTVDLSNPTQNATWFKNTSGYYNYYWRQIEESAA